MHRWERSHGRVGVNAPSWLTFEVHRPYLDGGDSPLTAIQSRGPLLAARLFAARDPATPRFGMVMPRSFRHLLTEESRLPAYRVTTPTDLAPELASADWLMLAEAHARYPELDDVDRTGLALWLVAVCLPDALLRLVPSDLDPSSCADPLIATVQCARGTALLQSGGSPAQLEAAYAAVIQAPKATVAQFHAHSSWSYYLARHGSDWSAAQQHMDKARAILDELSHDLPAFRRGILHARLLVRDVMRAERAGDLNQAWDLLEQARTSTQSATPATPEQEEISAEMWRRIIDRRVEIAVKRGDAEAEYRTVQEGLKLDPYCVKMRMQAAQLAQRRGDHDGALASYLTAARLGPHGTAFALLNAADCANRLDQAEFARVLTERAYRAAPRSERTRAALVSACTEAGDLPLAEMMREPATGHHTNWHYRMYGAYFNLGTSHSPCLYAGLPTFIYDFAVRGERSRIGPQRIMPPAFRTNLIRESGLAQFGVKHPSELAAGLRTPQWEQLCQWVAGFDQADLPRQYLIAHLLSRLGLRQLMLELVPERPVASLREPMEFYYYALRDIVRYADSQGGRSPVPIKDTFEMVDHPLCPLHLKLTGSVSGVVYAARGSKSLEDAVRWRDRAQEYLDAVLASDEFTPFEKVMLESRFYRGVGFVPFMRGDHAGTIDDMDRAEELARALPAQTPWEEFLKRENLHACLESRSKEAFGLRDIELGHRRTEEFLALDPHDPKSHIELAESLSKQERFVEAGESYLRAARLGPLGTAIAYAMAGECFSRAGALVLAEDCFVQSLRVDPYAISAARGWRRVAGEAMNALAHDYAGQLEEWGAARKGEPEDELTAAAP